MHCWTFWWANIKKLTILCLRLSHFLPECCSRLALHPPKLSNWEAENYPKDTVTFIKPYFPQCHKKVEVTWFGVEHFFSYESRLASMDKRNPDRLILSSEADLWNFSWSAFSSSSLCFLFFLLFLRSLALLELSLDPPEELSSDKPPLPPLYSPLSVAAAAATCQPITAQEPLLGATRGRLISSLHTKSRDKRWINSEHWRRREDRFMWSD